MQAAEALALLACRGCLVCPVRLGVQRISNMRNRFARPAMPGWPRQELYVTFRKERSCPTPEANMNAIPRKQRAMVRKGIKAGLASEIDETVDRFFDLYADNVHRHGTPAHVEEATSSTPASTAFGEACEVRSP
jgi:hypothetical protein